MMNNDDLHLNKISQQYDYSMQNLSNTINQNDDSCMELLDKLTFDDNSSNFITNSTNSNAYIQNNMEMKNDDKFCQEIMLALEKKDFTRILTLAISQSQNGHKMDGLLSETIQEIEKSSNKQVDVKIIEKLHSLLRSQPKSVATATPLRATVAPIRNESIVSSSSSNMSSNPGFRSNNKSSSSSMKLEPIQDDFLSLISSPDCKPPSSGTRSLPATPPISQVPNRPLSSHCVPIRSNERKPRTDSDLDLPGAGAAGASSTTNQPQYCSYTSSGGPMPGGPQMQYVPLNMSQFASQYQHHHHHQSLMAPNIVLMPMINAGANPGEQGGTVSQCVVPQVPGQVQMAPLPSQLAQPASQSNQISLLLGSAFFSMANSPGNQGATISTSHEGLPGPTTIAGGAGSSMRVSSLSSSGSVAHGSSNLPKLLPKPQQPLLMPRTSPMSTAGGYGAQLLTGQGLLGAGAHQQQHHLLASSHMGGAGGPGIITASGHGNGGHSGVAGHGGPAGLGCAQPFKRPTSRKSSSVKTARNNSSGSGGGNSRVSKAAANRNRECGVAAVVPSNTNKDNVAVAWEIAEQSGGLGDDGMSGIVLLGNTGPLVTSGTNVGVPCNGDLLGNTGQDGLGQYCDSLTLASNGAGVANNNQMDGLFEQHEAHSTDFDELFEELVCPQWSMNNDQSALLPGPAAAAAPMATVTVHHATVVVSETAYEDGSWCVARLLPAVGLRHAASSVAGAPLVTPEACRHRAPLPQSRCLLVVRQSSLLAIHEQPQFDRHEDQLAVPSAALLSSLRGVVATGTGGISNAAVVDSQRVMQLLYVHLGGRNSAAASLLSPLLKCLLPAAVDGGSPATTLAIATESRVHGHGQSGGGHSVTQTSRDKSVESHPPGPPCMDSGTVPNAVCTSVGHHPSGQIVSRPLSVCTRLSEQDELTEDDMLLTDISPVKRDPAQLACLDRFLESCHHGSLSPTSGTRAAAAAAAAAAASDARTGGGGSLPACGVGGNPMHRHRYGHHLRNGDNEELDEDDDDGDYPPDNEDKNEDVDDDYPTTISGGRSHPLMMTGAGAEHQHQQRRQELPFQRHYGDSDLTQFCGSSAGDSWLRKTKTRHRGKWALNGALLRCSKVLEVPATAGELSSVSRQRDRFLRKKSTFRSAAGVAGQHKQHQTQHQQQHRIKYQMGGGRGPASGGDPGSAEASPADSCYADSPQAPTPQCCSDPVAIGDSDAEQEPPTSAVAACPTPNQGGAGGGGGGLKVRIRLSQLKVVASTLPAGVVIDNSDGGATGDGHLQVERASEAPTESPTRTVSAFVSREQAPALTVVVTSSSSLSSSSQRAPRLAQTATRPMGNTVTMATHLARGQTGGTSSTKRIFCTRKEDRRSSALQSGTPGLAGTSIPGGAVTTGNTSPLKARKAAQIHSAGAGTGSSSSAVSPSKSVARARSNAARTRPATLPAACHAVAGGHPPLILKLSACRAANTTATVTSGSAASPAPPPKSQAFSPDDRGGLLSLTMPPDEPTRACSPQQLSLPLPGTTTAAAAVSTGSLKLRLRRSEDRVYQRQGAAAGALDPNGVVTEEPPPQDPGGCALDYKMGVAVAQQQQHQQSIGYEFSAALQLVPPQLSRPRPQLAALQFSPAHSSSDSDVDVTHNEISSLLQRQEQRDPLLSVSRAAVHAASAAAAGPGAPVSKPPLPGGATPGGPEHAGSGLPVPYLVGSEPMVFIDPHECDLLVVRNSKYKRTAPVGASTTGSTGVVGSSATATQSSSSVSRQHDLHGDHSSGLISGDGGGGQHDLQHAGGTDPLDPGGDLAQDMLLPGCFVERDKDTVAVTTKPTATTGGGNKTAHVHERMQHQHSTHQNIGGGAINNTGAVSGSNACWNTSHSSPPMPVLAPQEPFTTAASATASNIASITDHASASIAATATAVPTIRPSPSSASTATHQAVIASSYDYSCHSLGHHSNQSFSNHDSDLQQSPLCMSTSVQQNPLQSSQYSQSASSHNDMRPDHKPVASGTTKSPYQHQHSSQHSSYYQQQQQQQQTYNSICYHSDASNVANVNANINNNQSHSSKTQLHQSSPISASLMSSSATTCSSQHIQQQQDYAPYFHNAAQSLASSDTAPFSSMSQLSSSAYHPHLSDMHQQSSSHSSSKRSSSNRSHPGGDPSAAKKRKEAALQQQQQQQSAAAAAAAALPVAQSLQLSAAAVYGNSADLYNAAAMSGGGGQYGSGFDYYNGFSDIMSGIVDPKIYEHWTRELCSPMPWVAEYCKQAAVANHLMPAAAVAAAGGFPGLSSVGVGGGGPGSVPNPLALQSGLRASVAGVTGSAADASDYPGSDLAGHPGALGPDQLKPLSYLDQYKAAAYMAQPYMYSAFGAMPK